MLAALSGLIVASGALAIYTHARAPRAFYVFKPLTTLLIVALAWLAPGGEVPAYRGLILGGLLLSLAGDVFLMLPGDRFVAGLASFLAAHLLYIAAFSSRAPLAAAPLAALPFAAAGLVLLRALWPQLSGLRAAVALYALVLVTMGWRALAQASALETGLAWLAAAGAAAFAASDAMLAWNRFRAPLAHAQLAVLSTYYAAQWAIALSVHGV